MTEFRYKNNFEKLLNAIYGRRLFAGRPTTFVNVTLRAYAIFNNALLSSEYSKLLFPRHIVYHGN